MPIHHIAAGYCRLLAWQMMQRKYKRHVGHSSAGGAESHLSRELRVHAPAALNSPLSSSSSCSQCDDKSLSSAENSGRTDLPPPSQAAVAQFGSAVCNLALRARFW